MRRRSPRANMRFVPTETAEQQSGLVLHRTRHLLIRQQTSVINGIRAHFAEFGIVAPVGRRRVEELLSVVGDASDGRLPEIARTCLAALSCPSPDAQDADTELGPNDHGLASVEQDEQAAR